MSMVGKTREDYIPRAQDERSGHQEWKLSPRVLGKLGRFLRGDCQASFIN